jgi:uncharacterized protein (DUF983 family)
VTVSPRAGPKATPPVAGAAPGPFRAGLRGLCPRCGAKTLFAGLAAFAPKCRACGLDFSAYNVGDGPAAFLVLILGALITGLAITVDLEFSPPFWVHALLWVPITAIAVVVALRFAKGLLLAIEWAGGDKGNPDRSGGR